MLFVLLYLGILAATCVAIWRIDAHQKSCATTDDIPFVRIEAGEVV